MRWSPDIADVAAVAVVAAAAPVDDVGAAVPWFSANWERSFAVRWATSVSICTPRSWSSSLLETSKDPRWWH